MRKSEAQKIYGGYMQSLRRLVAQGRISEEQKGTLLGRLEASLPTRVLGARTLDRAVDYRSFDCDEKLAVRIRNALIENHIYTYRDLTESFTQVLLTKNIGKKSLEIIEDHVKKTGYSFKDGYAWKDR